MSGEKISIYQLKITLLDTNPAVWRRVLVKSDTTLGELHNIVQIVMGWQNYHLHQFIIDGICYGVPDSDFGLDVYDEQQAQIESVVSEVNQSFIYEYDFGDSWEHEIKVEKILAPDTGEYYPVCTDGKRACPPEDCGGVWGYADLLEIIKNPHDPEYEDTLEWLGDDFDPESFDLEEINYELEDFD